MTFFIPLICLVCWLGIARIIFKHEFSWQEMLLQAVPTIVVIGLVSMGSMWMNTYDTKLVSGVVTGTEIERQSCRQYWSDYSDSFCTNEYTRIVPDGENCTTDSKGNETCTTRYKTQYKAEFPWEQKFRVSTTVDYYTIDRIDRQGALTPPRYSIIKIGDPVTTTKSFTNYIKGAASTLFNKKLSKVDSFPYPKVYDYYHVNRVIFDNDVVLDGADKFNDSLAHVLSAVNMPNVILFITDKPQERAEELAQSWNAHKINDVVISVGIVPDTKEILWSDVRSWSKDKIVNVVLRDDVDNLHTFDFDKILDIVQTQVPKYYQQRDIEDFAYLKDDIETPMWVIIVMGIIIFVAGPAISFYFSRKDVRL